MRLFVVVIVGLALPSVSMMILPTSAGVAYPDPPDGWTYVFEGDQDSYGIEGTGFSSLDGTWNHDNGSDNWDGSKIGGDIGANNRPGGVSALTEEGVTFLRIQDTGDPRDHGTDFEFSDPGSNRRIFLLHDLGPEVSPRILDEGITFSFRARLPTSGPIDPHYPDEQTATQPYPESGDGTFNTTAGRGNFVIHQKDGGAIAFSLATPQDLSLGPPETSFTGLMMNGLDGIRPSSNIDFAEGRGMNVIPLDPTQWHEFWIAVRKDPKNVGTHEAQVFVDGSRRPFVFTLTVGTAVDLPLRSYLGIGTPFSPQSGAIDVDFFAYKTGIHFPDGVVAQSSFGGVTGQTEIVSTWVQGDKVHLAFVAAPGEEYRIDFKRSLADRSWTTLRIVNAGKNIIYDNSEDYLSQFYAAGNGVEYGDEILFNSGVHRVVTDFQFQYLAPVNFTGGQGRFSIYANDGPLADDPLGNLVRAPGTLLFQTASFDLVRGFQTVTVSDLWLVVPNSLTWTVLFSGMRQGSEAGLMIFNPPTVGISFDDFWQKADADWQVSLISDGLVPANFAARVRAQPAPTLAPPGTMLVTDTLNGGGERYYRVIRLIDGLSTGQPVRIAPPRIDDNNNIVFAFPAEAGLSYRIEFSPSLLVPDWTVVDRLRSFIPTNLEFHAPAGTVAQGYFRVVAEANPR